MQPRTTRGLRRILVSTGVIAVVLCAAAPGALAAPGPQDDVAEIDPPAADTDTEAPRAPGCPEDHGGGAVAPSDDLGPGDDDCSAEPGRDVTDGPDGPRPVIAVSSTIVTRPPAAPAAPVSPPPPAAPVEPATPARPVAPVEPATPAAVAAPTAPAVPAPSAATPTATTGEGPEVLGSVTSRTPGIAGSTVTGPAVTALAATGTSTTTLLAIVGSALLLAGLCLQLAARRHVAGSAVGA